MYYSLLGILCSSIAVSKMRNTGSPSTAFARTEHVLRCAPPSSSAPPAPPALQDHEFSETLWFHHREGCPAFFTASAARMTPLSSLIPGGRRLSRNTADLLNRRHPQEGLCCGTSFRTRMNLCCQSCRSLQKGPPKQAEHRSSTLIPVWVHRSLS